MSDKNDKNTQNGQNVKNGADSQSDESYYESLLTELQKNENADSELNRDKAERTNGKDEAQKRSKQAKAGKKGGNGKANAAAEKNKKPLSRKERKEKFTRIFQIFLTVLKSLMSLVCLGLCFTIFVFLNDSLFGIYLFLYIIIFAIGSYLLSIVCLLINFFKTKLFGKWWTVVSAASILIMILAIALSEMLEIDGFTYVFCVVLGLQAVPVIFEVYQFEKHRERKRLTDVNQDKNENK